MLKLASAAACFMVASCSTDLLVHHSAGTPPLHPTSCRGSSPQNAHPREVLLRFVEEDLATPAC